MVKPGKAGRDAGSSRKRAGSLEKEIRDAALSHERELADLTKAGGEAPVTVSSVEMEAGSFVSVWLPRCRRFEWGLLCPKEKQVALLVREGLGNKEIASRLGVKECTVIELVHRMLGKLGRRSRTDLVFPSLKEKGPVRRGPTADPAPEDHPRGLV